MSMKYEKKSYIDVIKANKPEPMDYSVSFSNDRSRTKFIKKVERLVRMSMEYRDYIVFLRENVGMDACAFFSNVSKDTSKRIKIEVHHAPFTLYDICDIVLCKYEKSGLPINALDISDEVMMLHYKNMVGLVPLSKTLHEVIHSSDKLIIPATVIYGNYKTILQEYEKYDIPEYIYDKCDKLIEQTKMIKNDTFDVLKRKFIYIDVDGFQVPQKIEDENKEEGVA